MTSSTGDDSTSVESKRVQPGSLLLGVVVFNLLVGIFFSLFLLGLPSDPERAQIGRYSPERVQLILGIAAATVVWAIFAPALTWKRGWRTSLGELMFGKARWVERLLPFAFLLVLSIYVGSIMYFPTYIELTRYHYIRLAPYLLWPWTLLMSLAMAARIGRGDFRVPLNPKTAQSLGVVGLFLLSFLARAPLSGYGLPYPSVDDEVVTYTRALELISGGTILEGGKLPNYGRATYGDPLLYVTAAGQMAGLFLKMRTGSVYNVGHYASPADGVSSVLEAVHDSGAPLQYPRLLLALVNSLTVIFIYASLRRHFKAGFWISLAGGLIYSVFSPAAMAATSFILPDGLATMLATAAIFFGLESIQTRQIAWLPEIACAALAGVAVSVSIRYAAFAGVPFLALAFAQTHRRWIERAALMAVVVLVAFLATSPTLLHDLGDYVARLTDLAWYADDSLQNRVTSLTFYLRSMFLGEGLGLLVLALALLGYTFSLWRSPRLTLFLTAIALVHFMAVTSTRYRRGPHVLVLYPPAAIMAAECLQLAQDRLSRFLHRAGTSSRRLGGRWPAASGLPVFLVFMAASAPKLSGTAHELNLYQSFKPSQVRMAEYVKSHLEDNTRVGLLGIVPFANRHLEISGADVHRVPLSITIDQLRDEGFRYVIGTDRIGPGYPGGEGTVWVSDLASDQQKVFEVGKDPLASPGAPNANLLLYLSRVPRAGTDP